MNGIKRIVLAAALLLLLVACRQDEAPDTSELGVPAETDVGNGRFPPVRSTC
jgi:hypothetical protein